MHADNSIWVEIAVFVLGGGAYGLMAQPLAVSALAGAVIITVYELAVGLLVNVKFGWHVWDYSAQPGNVLGQICPTFTAIWFVVCFLFLSGVRLLMHAV